jgi:glycosyltransferase involved in cell wall biosynthesis
MISVITPTHNSQWIGEVLNCLRSQTYQGDWEWLIVPNNDVSLPQDVLDFDRLHLEPYFGTANVGALKRFACERAKGDIIVELDHDDLLTPTALESVADALSNGADFAYSNFAEFNDDEERSPRFYDPGHGWVVKKEEHYGREYVVHQAFEADPRSLSAVHYAPNHVRAWKRDAYDRVGGHNPDMKVVDDHDLCCRFYLEGKMTHIDECLYLYRVHGDNSYLIHNQEIQQKTATVRARYLWKMIERWCDRNDLLMVDLGSAHNKPENYVGVDKTSADGVQVVQDVTNGLPFADNSVGVCRAFDFLEHIATTDTVALMNEVYRVLVDGGWLISMTPSTDGRGAYQDPTHVSYWNENSFWYYTNESYAKYVSEIRCRFQALQLYTGFPSEWHRQNQISYVYADLSAVKSDERRPGQVLI